MKHLATLLGLCLLAPATVVASGASIAAALYKILADAETFSADLDLFTGPSTFGPLLVDSVKLAADFNDGITTARQSAPLSEEEATALIAPTTQLVNVTLDALDALVAKKALFQSTGTLPIALYGTQLTKSGSDQFQAAVLEKTPIDLQPAALELTAPLDPAFDTAIAALSS